MGWQGATGTRISAQAIAPLDFTYNTQGHRQNSYELQDRDSRALNQVWGPSECRALGDYYIGHTPLKPALRVSKVRVIWRFSVIEKPVITG